MINRGGGRRSSRFVGGRPCHRQGSGGEARGGWCAPVGGHGSSRGGPRRWGHAEQRLTGGGSLGRGTPATFGLGENAQGMEGDEVDAMTLTTRFTAARGGGMAVVAGASRRRPWRLCFLQLIARAR
jgi:hypothetical protein